MNRHHVNAGLAGAVATLSLLAASAAAWAHPDGIPPVIVPEIDGPAGIAAIALLACAGIVAYNRYRK